MVQPLYTNAPQPICTHKRGCTMVQPYSHMNFATHRAIFIANRRKTKLLLENFHKNLLIKNILLYFASNNKHIACKNQIIIANSFNIIIISYNM